MSIKVSSAIWEHSKQKGTALLMLLAIADHSNDAGIAWPSIETLAAKARVSQRQAQRIIKQLVEDGEIMVDVGVGRGNTSLYRVIFEKGDTDDTFNQEKVTSGAEKVTSGAEKVTSGAVKGDIAMSPEPLEPLKKPSGKPFKPPSPPPLPSYLASAAAMNAYGEWIQYHEDRGRPLTRATASKQHERLKEWGEERWIAAIDYSIENNYTGLIEPKRGKNNQTEPAAFAGIREVMEEIEYGIT